MNKNIKFWHSLKVKPEFLITDNHNTVIITTYREGYDITRNIRIVYLFFSFFFLTSSFVSKFVCFREIIAGFDIDESYTYIQLDI